MTENITLVRGDDTNFFNQTLLVVSFKTVLNLDGYKLRLTVENPTNIMKQFEVHNNTAEINFGKIDSSTFGVGQHKANLKLIDTLGRVKTMYLLDINVEDEFNASVDLLNEYEIEIELDTDGISKYKNYNELHNKPLINDIVLEGNKTFDELGFTQHITEATQAEIERHTLDPESHKDIRDELHNKQERLIAGANITIIDGIISSLGAEGGITTDYKHLGNKPKINGVVLDDNRTLEELGIQQLGDYITEEMLLQKGFLTSIPSGYITEEELHAENYIKEIPPEYYTNTQNKEIYATIEQNNLKQDKLTAGDNIEIVEQDGSTIISAQIPQDYVTQESLQELGYVTNETVNKRLDKKQNIMFAGDNIRIKSNTDGTYTISAIDSKNPSEIVSYNALNNKPTINGVSLIGNKTAEELKLQPAGQYQGVLTAGDNIEIQNLVDGTNIIKAIIPDDLCTDNELQLALETKANKSTTLSGYEIEDAYTKQEVDTLIIDSSESKVTDIIVDAPNGVASYTEDCITVKSGLGVYFSNGLNTNNTYKNIKEYTLEDIKLNASDFDVKDFYLALTYTDSVNATLISKDMYKVISTENIPLDKNGYIKNVNKNKVYKVTDGIIEEVYIKIIGEGVLTYIANGVSKISSFVPYGVHRLVNQDEFIAGIEHLQEKITVGENFEFKNNKLEYKIPFNYVTREFLIENDYATQTNIHDRVDVHNVNSLSHEDIRTRIDEVENKIPTKTSDIINDSEYVTATALKQDYCTREEYDLLVQRVKELEEFVELVKSKEILITG